MELCVVDCLKDVGASGLTRFLACVLWTTYESHYSLGDVLRSFANLCTCGYGCAVPQQEDFACLEETVPGQRWTYPKVLTRVRDDVKKCLVVTTTASVTDLCVCAARCEAAT